MAIQFPCPSCGQPIEVDDEWASKPVACPYCRKTVNAPETTTFVPDASMTTASPVSPSIGASPAAYDAGLSAYAPQVQDRNPVAVWSLVLTVSAVVLYFGASFAMINFITARVGPDATPQELQKAVLSELEQGAFPAGLAVASVGYLVALLCWLAGMVLAVVAMAKSRAKRGWAIASLLVGGGLFLLLCVGSAVQMAV